MPIFIVPVEARAARCLAVAVAFIVVRLTLFEGDRPLQNVSLSQQILCVLQKRNAQ
jgi:hypothetical protein